MRRLAALLVLAALACRPASALGPPPPEPFAHLPKSEVEIVTATGTHRFKVWIAADEISRARGLMFIRRLPADQGMLFLFEKPQIASFWMKDTYLALDLVFIRSAGQVSDVVRHATPHSLEPIVSSAPILAVLELPAGTAERIGLFEGSHVRHPLLELVKRTD